MRSASSMVGSDELPSKDRTGSMPRYLKYSVGFLPQVISWVPMPCLARRSISCWTRRWGTMLKPPAMPRSDATRMKSTVCSSVRG